MRIFAFLLLAASCVVQAQTYTPQQFVFNGAPAYSRQELTAALGLAPGKPLATKDVDAALPHLGDTGLFADIRYTIDNRSLTFTLVPQPESSLLPVLYNNFVLFSPGELTPLVHARVPLFQERIPPGGSLQQSVQDALVAILHDKGLTATVESINVTERPGGPVAAVSFSITQPAVLVRALRVDSVSPLAQPRVAEVQKAIANSEYDRTSQASARRRLQDTYADLALLDAVIPMPVLGAPVIEPTRILVDLSTSVQEGTPYRLASLNVPVSPIVTPAEMAKAVILKPGDPATRIGLLATSAQIKRQFTRRGYFDAAITSSQVKDSTAHTLAVTLAVEPGPLFHLKSVRTVNLNEAQQKEFDANWKLTPGAPYDDEYVATFLRKNSALKSFQGYSATYKNVINSDTHTIDLVMTFVKGGVLVQ